MLFSIYKVGYRQYTIKIRQKHRRQNDKVGTCTHVQIKDTKTQPTHIEVQTQVAN